MNKWRVTYKSKIDGDCTSVWCNAKSAEDAALYVRREYWDVAEIICVEKI